MGEDRAISKTTSKPKRIGKKYESRLTKRPNQSLLHYPSNSQRVAGAPKAKGKGTNPVNLTGAERMKRMEKEVVKKGKGQGNIFGNAGRRRVKDVHQRQEPPNCPEQDIGGPRWKKFVKKGAAKAIVLPLKMAGDPKEKLGPLMVGFGNALPDPAACCTLLGCSAARGGADHTNLYAG